MKIKKGKIILWKLVMEIVARACSSSGWREHWVFLGFWQGLLLYQGCVQFLKIHQIIHNYLYISIYTMLHYMTTREQIIPSKSRYWEKAEMGEK